MAKSLLLNDRFLKACLGEAVDQTPLWLMRQAGRYLPEYNATRARAGSFLGLAKNPAYATEVTLQPLDRYPLDAAILFSDILTIPDAMGLGLQFAVGEGPSFQHPLRTEEDVKKLRAADMHQLQYVFDAVSEIRKALIQDGKQRVPLIGFSGSPWTLACYMIDGSGSDDFRHAKTMMFARPDLLEHILEINVQSVATYLTEQVKAGAQALMIFDTWGGLLPNGWYQRMSLAAMQKVIEQLPREYDGRKIPIIIFTKGGGIWLKDMAQIGADVLALDWTMSLSRARKELLEINRPLALQGNLDPLVLFSGSKHIADQVNVLLEDLADAPVLRPNLHPLDGHIFNLGHGISQFTPPESVSALASAVIEKSRALRASR
ncbi:uroporphyrinogen decarboxylase [Polynucleobacter paludilacus]|uniref:uroporphyrinogen decarboxylase n=1 Tax=Polynucleobacter paludilacus TaxID=1855895 RepID=UPI001BFE5060|nr:uroporphyrinogen decarboxylase [Polynucleobacter paludilacus]QWD87834.1 uroporphyrinogen decarboxylase [Polynucleobacter paludilacus]